MSFVGVWLTALTNSDVCNEIREQETPNRRINGEGKGHGRSKR